MDQRSALGEFLRSRRARLRPGDVGLADHGGRRRVPGLRREELAQLAGISAGYYTRLEQGLSPNASDAVLDAVARVLRLDEGERAHLRSLARPVPASRRAAPAERVRPGVAAMVESLEGLPVLAVGRRSDVLAWNRLAHALLAGHLEFRAPERPNLARLVFLDPRTRELYADWDRKARDAVGFLRRSAGQFPDDPELAGLIGELTDRSPDFASLWSSHAVRECAYNTREYRHPLVGSLTLTDEMLHLPDDPGQRMVIYHPEDDPSAKALRALADAAAVEAAAP
jgi:transcriptional regulator with XRE-family HTH domain